MKDQLADGSQSSGPERSEDLNDSESLKTDSEVNDRVGYVTIAQDSKSERTERKTAPKPLKLIFEEDDQIGHAIASELLRRQDERGVIIEVKKPSTHWQPCSGCGVITNYVCADLCDAATYMPQDSWFTNQATPLCAKCSRLHQRCHYCRGVSWATPPRGIYDPESSGDPEASPTYSGRTFFPKYEVETVSKED